MQRLDLRIVFLIVLLTTIGFWEIQNFDFINLDDDVYVTANHYVRTGLNKSNIIWAFTTTHVGFWIPMTWLSFMLDSQLYGLNPQGYHVTNLLFHISNAVLLYWVLRKFGKSAWKSAFVAILFSLHPLHVESVAWVTERKDVLSAFFALVSLGLYIGYVRSSGPYRYGLCLLAFAAGLMAKPMLVTFPLLLLLLDYWPLRRLEGSTGAKGSHESDIDRLRSSIFRLLMEKIPFFILSLAVGAVTFLSHKATGGMAPLESLSLSIRIANSLVSYVSYIWKMIWPKNLAVFYPHAGALSEWEVVGAGAVVVLISLGAVLSARTYPYVIVGWGWYLLSLFPVIGIVQVGRQSMADRFTYIPLIGLFIIAVWGLSDVSRRWPYRRLLSFLLGGIAISACLVMTRHQAGYWENSIVLFEHALTVTDESDLVHNNLASALAREGRFVQAIEHGERALSINPRNAWTHNNMGVALAGLNRFNEACGHYKTAVRIKPNFANAHSNLGNLFARQGLLNDAVGHYRKALRINPYDAHAHNNLAHSLAALGKDGEAVTHYYQALAIMPNHAAARHGLKALSQKFEGGYQPEGSPCSGEL